MELPESLRGSLFKASAPAGELRDVKGYDFNQGISLEAVLGTYMTTGLQATNLALAIEEVNKMLSWRLSDEEVKEGEDITDPAERAKVKCTIFLAYTSNVVSCGLREIVRYLAQHRLVDVIVTTAGGVEEDFIKCLAPSKLGAFDLRGSELRSQGLNRIGNMLVPNRNYCLFEEWIMPILDKMLEEQKSQGKRWTPSGLIERLGMEINNEESVYYWCARNGIKVFCPAVTDGSIGDMLYCHSYTNPGLVVDLVGDIRLINDTALTAKKSGMLILGGGTSKHHTANANLMRNGADFAVYLNMGLESEGSDAGASPDEAVSWGKIKLTARPVKVFAEVSLVFPLLVARSFAEYHGRNGEGCEYCRARS
jgi:deoxyhypusine synthase